MTATASSTTDKPVLTIKKSLYYHWLCISLMIFTIIIAIYLGFGDSDKGSMYPAMNGLGWTVQVVITIVFIAIIRCKNVSEGLGCLRETFAMLMFELIIIFMTPIMFAVVPLMLPMMIIYNLATYIQGFIPMCITYIMFTKWIKMTGTHLK